ncbi:hypothetical protein KP79_PYT06601 [Mizuhopecten yessoensis]|uniref:Uncharacterized protein n=1 Tax=Mizuhopecten yessoensis TaxID=6573 RepID=A0A210R1P9_MIZYE|nr:hypothetical protein KP79_PYT06601 [Mizuhopecten yessoensis]
MHSKSSTLLPMCRNGSLTSGRVVVDTYDTGVLDYDSCRCTVSLSGTNTGPVNLQTGPYSRTAPASDCGSILRFNRHPTNTYTEYQCTRITGDIISDFASSELLNITLSKVNNNIQWQSGYCILIRTGVNITVTCDDAGELGASSASTPTTKTTPATTTITTPSSSSVQTVTNITDNGGDVNGGYNYVKDKSIGIGVIAGAAGGGAVLVIIFIIVIVVIIIRKKGADVKRTEGNFAVDIQPYAVTTPKFYHNEGVDTITHNSLYESAGPRDPDTNHIVTETGDVYAQVQKPNKHTHSETEQSNHTEHSQTTPSGDVYAVVNKPNKHTHSETEHSNHTEHSQTTPSGDVYAVVNKPKKGANNTKDELHNDDNKRPSRYKNQEGLMYAEVDDTTSRPRSRPPVRPKPTSNADRVIYSEVDTGV